MVELTIVSIIIIICISVLFGLYMYLCYGNGTRMFLNPKYEERIRNLEKLVKELKEDK